MMDEKQRVYKLSYEHAFDMPDMYCADLKEVSEGLATMMDGAEIGTIIKVELVGVESGYMDGLEPWDP